MTDNKPFCSLNTSNVLSYISESVPTLTHPDKHTDQHQLLRDSWETRLEIGRVVSSSFFDSDVYPPNDFVEAYQNSYSHRRSSSSNSHSCPHDGNCNSHSHCSNCLVLGNEVEMLKQQVEWLTAKVTASDYN
ncbi:hypothetical protein GEMRC1_012884 [Eukaryota sp. GEM-RC1]